MALRYFNKKAIESRDNSAFNSNITTKLGNYKFNEKVFGISLYGFGVLILLILVGVIISLLFYALPAIKEFGFGFLFSTTWDPVAEKFGALQFVIGTLMTASISLLIALPFAMSLAIFLGEYYRRGRVSSIIKSMTELLAGIPSVIYGFWGIFIIVPLIRVLMDFFKISGSGYGILSASVVLAIMIIPYAASISREVIELVPNDLKEAAYSLGATRFEVIVKIVIPYAFSGIFAGIILALGRALGETMAVTLLIGNRNGIPTNLFASGNTMASIIANQFNEAGTTGLLGPSLIYIGLLLLLITGVINVIGKLIIKRFNPGR